MFYSGSQFGIKNITHQIYIEHQILIEGTLYNIQLILQNKSHITVN